MLISIAASYAGYISASISHHSAMAASGVKFPPAAAMIPAASEVAAISCWPWFIAGRIRVDGMGDGATDMLAS